MIARNNIRYHVNFCLLLCIVRIMFWDILVLPDHETYFGVLTLGICLPFSAYPLPLLVLSSAFSDNLRLSTLHFSPQCQIHLPLYHFFQWSTICKWLQNVTMPKNVRTPSMKMLFLIIVCLVWKSMQKLCADLINVKPSQTFHNVCVICRNILLVLSIEGNRYDLPDPNNFSIGISGHIRAHHFRVCIRCNSSLDCLCCGKEELVSH